LDSFISIFPVTSVEVEIAKAGGLYKCEYGKSHGVGLADAILVAIAEAVNTELKTLNFKHYPMDPNTEPVYKKHCFTCASCPKVPQD
jgi:predicted nucleic acid-binding protein